MTGPRRDLTFRTTGHPPLSLVVAFESWMDDGICAQTDPEMFFPEKGGSTREAKLICRGCPVIAECLAYAIAHQERFGIWGGHSERDRRKLYNPNTLTEPRPRRRREGIPPTQTRLTLLGLAPSSVRAWAKATGHARYTDRGRIPDALLDDYLEAQRRDRA